MGRTKKAPDIGFDVKAASTMSLTDFGGAAAALIKKTEVKIDAIKNELRSRAGNLPNDQELTEAGDDYTVTVGVVPETTEISEMDNKKLIKIIGQDNFNTLAKFPVGLLKEYLSKRDFDKISAKGEGTRRVAFKERTEND